MSDSEKLAFRRSICTPRTPPKSERNTINNDGGLDHSQTVLSMTPSQKRHREGGTPPDLRPAGKKVNVASVISEAQNPSNCWNTASFADVLKGPSDLQVAIRTEPPRQFTPEDRLDFIDAIGETIFQDPGCVPTFESTSIRGNFLIVNAVNEFSFQWLLSNSSKLFVWPDSSLVALPASEIPRLKKALLWLPGRRRIPTPEILLRLEKFNPLLDCRKWRVFSRKEEAHGCRVLVGFEDSLLEALKEIKMKPFWSTVRAQVTLVDEVRTKRKNSRKARTVQGSLNAESHSQPVHTDEVNSESIPVDPDIVTSQISKKDDAVQLKPEENASCTPVNKETHGKEVPTKTIAKPARKGSKGNGSTPKITNFLRMKSLENSTVTNPNVNDADNDISPFQDVYSVPDSLSSAAVNNGSEGPNLSNKKE